MNVPALPWSRQRSARWTRRYLAVDSGKYAGRTKRHPWAQWWAFQVALWLAWRLRWCWLTDLAHWLCQPRWVGMDGMTWGPWRPSWWPWKDEVPF